MKRLSYIIQLVVLLCMISCHSHIGSGAEMALADSLINVVRTNHSNHPTILSLQYCQRIIDLLPNNDIASLSRKERLYIEMGRLFAKQLLYDEAIDRFHLAYGCAAELQDTIIMIDAYKCVGDMYRKKHNLGEAVHFYDLAEQLAIQSSAEKPRISLALHLAATFMEDGKLDLATEFLPSASYEVEGADNELYNYVMWHVYSFTNHGNKDSAEYYLRKMSESPDIYYRKYAVDIEHSAAIAGGDIKKAYWTNHQKTKLEKEMSDIFREEVLESLNSMYQTLSMERQNASLQERNQQIKFYAMIAVLLLVLVIAVSAIVIYRIINSRIQLEHTKTMTIRDADIYQHLLSTMKVMSETEQHEAWELINKVYPDFLPTLQKLGVEKEQDLKVCLLLKMGFMPSRIAALVSRSDSAIANTRARLHKKVFGKDGKAEDWDNFIISL
jgi:tetratricopeptide (TPR) repeat protein